MRLNVGDILYLNMSGTQFSDIPFEIANVRKKTTYNGDDICIKWVDGTDWWWGQIGESEPWTIKFITKEEYMRNKKLDILLT